MGVTYWNRLEPRPRSRDINEALKARVRDPLWMLARQWQMTEWTAEDAASPAFVSLTASTALVAAEQAQFLEPQQLSEETVAGYSLSLALGDLVEALLMDFVPDLDRRREVRKILVTSAPLDAPDGSRRATDLSQAVLDVCSGASIDGHGLLQLLRRGTPAEWADDVREVCSAFVRESAAIYDPGSDKWDNGNLEYRFEISAQARGERVIDLTGIVKGEPAAGWPSFIVARELASDPAAFEPLLRTVLPSRLRFKGMPALRWWDFEEGTADYGALRCERRDLGRMLVMDFMLVQANDWYVLPIEVPVGSLVRLDRFEVHDVFGQITSILPAREPNWSMYNLSARNGAASPWLFLSPSAAAHYQPGLVLEDVLLCRDEVANAVWSIERVIQDALGVPSQALDLYQPTERLTTERPAEDTGTTALDYEIQTDVPVNWFPFVAIEADESGGVRLRRAVLLDDAGQPVATHSTFLADPRLTVDQREVASLGRVFRRRTYRTRGPDGRTHVWVSRSLHVGAGETSTGLSFDVTKSSESD